jgi:hypothetical protein
METTPPTFCELCEGADAAGLWYAVALCVQCLTRAVAQEAAGRCVCLTCLQHQHDQAVQP